MIDINKLFELNNKFILAISNFIAHELSAKIEKYTGYFDETLSNNLLSYISHIPCSSSTILSFIFNIYIKTSVTHPQESYKSIMGIIKSKPCFLKNTSLHPEYTYEPAPLHTFNNCPICNGNGTPYFNAFSFKMSDFYSPHTPVKLWMKCSNCTNLYTYQYPEKLLTLPVTSSNILPNPQSFINATSTSSSYKLSSWGNILESIYKYTSNKNLLEVGIGSGELIAVAQELGYNVTAIEIKNEVAQKISNMLNIPIWNGDFLNYISTKKYSIIIMGDVIEHVTNPVKALEIAYNLLENDGILWLSTPNFESSFSRILKFNVPMWGEPHHITYFSFNGFMYIAEQCNFELKDYRISNIYQGSMKLILSKKQNSSYKILYN